MDDLPRRHLFNQMSIGESYYTGNPLSALHWILPYFALGDSLTVRKSHRKSTQVVAFWGYIPHFPYPGRAPLGMLAGTRGPRVRKPDYGQGLSPYGVPSCREEGITPESVLRSPDGWGGAPRLTSLPPARSEHATASLPPALRGGGAAASRFSV